MRPRTATTCFSTAALGLFWVLLSLGQVAMAEGSSSGSGSGNPQLDQMQQSLSNEANAINQQSQQNAQAIQQAGQQAQQDQQNSDRKKQQNTAMALAAVGAGIAGMSCIMMMIAAQQEEDPAMKKMMMSQAMQQCGQAAQDMANAAQNDNGQNQLTDPSPPTPPQLQTPAAPTSQPTSKPVQLPTDSNAPMPDTQLADNNNGQPPSAFDVPTVAPPDLTNTDAVVTANSTSTLNPIPAQDTTYDESAKPDQSGSGSISGSGLGGPSFSASGSNTTPNAKQPATDAASNKAGNHGKGDSADAYAGGIGGIGGIGGGPGKEGSPSGNEAGSGETNINAMLAGLMGNQVANTGPAGSGLGDSLYYGAKGGGGKKGQRPPNIFQYAAYRIKKLSKQTVVMRAATHRNKPGKVDPGLFRGKHRSIAAVKP